jgi:hypothetical protein
MANLTELIGKKVPDYVEFAWVCAPSDNAQPITQNVYNTVYMNTTVLNTIAGASLSAGSAPPSTVTTSFTIPKGKYYFEAGPGLSGYTVLSYNLPLIFSLYNITTSTYVAKMTKPPFQPLNGLIDISSPSQFNLQVLSSQNFTLGKNWNNGAMITNSTSNADQRATIKLWKLI